MLRAILWDVDGTLAETEETHRRAFTAAFERAGLPYRWDREVYGRLLRVSGGRERLVRFFRDIGLAGTEAEIDNLAAGLHAQKTAIFAELLAAGGLAPRPGVARLIRQAAGAGLRQAVVTTTSRTNVERLLAGMPDVPGQAFEFVVAGQDVARKKPDPEAYLLALGRLGLPAEACLAVEDSRNGLRAALAAGVACLVTPSLYTAGEDFSGALAVVEDLGEPGRPSRLIYPGEGRPDEDRDEVIDLAVLGRWLKESRPSARPGVP